VSTIFVISQGGGLLPKVLQQAGMDQRSVVIDATFGRQLAL